MPRATRASRYVHRLGAAALAVICLTLGGAAGAGCLAPTDAIVDGAGTVGPFWGNDAGQLLYARDLTGVTETLVIRELETAGQIVAQRGETNDFFVGFNLERWETFNAGTINADGDIGLVASTVIPDDPLTQLNEALPRRGAYFRRSNTIYRIGRFGLDSPIDDAFGDPVPWGSFFDAVALGRLPSGFGRALVTAQLGAPDGRTGIFLFDEDTVSLTPLLLTGDPSPAGGTYQTIARTRANAKGDAAIFALTESGGTISPGLFLRDSNGSGARIVKLGLSGDAAPGGGNFSILNDFAIDGTATIYFAATLAGAPSPSGLFKAAPPVYVPTVVVLEGDETPLGGTFDTFEAATVRASADGTLIFGVPLSDDIGGSGIFSVVAGGNPLPLANEDGVTTVAAVAEGSAAYQTPAETHIVLPAGGEAAGPNHFRIVKVDLKNKTAINKDTLKSSGAFRLPPFGDGPGETAPVVFGDAPQSRITVGRVWADGELARITEVIVTVSSSPGNEFTFGIDNADGGTLRYNNLSQRAPSVKFAKDGSSATWSFRANPGRGKLTVDLAKQTYDFKLSRGTLQSSFEPIAFRVRITLRSRADVVGAVADEDSLLHGDVRIDALQPKFGSGRRVVSDGAGVPGGSLFVDTLRVKRSLKVRKGQAAPEVKSDSVQVTGALRLCPGSTPPSTPGLTGDFTIGDLVLNDFVLRRRGRSGSRYRFKSGRGETPKVTVDVDLVKGLFKIKATGVTPLTDLVDADFSGAVPANTAAADVAGMSIPFSISIDRAYEDAIDLPMTRRKGGKKFER